MIDVNLKLKIKRAILFSGDMLCLYLSLFAALLLRFGSKFDATNLSKHLPYFSIVFIVWLIMIFSFRFYETNKPIKSKYDLLMGIINFSILNFLLSVLYFYIFPKNLITPKTILVFAIIAFAIIFYFWRVFANKLLYRGKSKTNCLIISNNDELIYNIEQKPELDLNIKSILNPNNNIFSNIKKIDIQNFREFINTNKIQTIIIDDDLLFDENISKILLEYLSNKKEIIKTTEFYEKFLGKVALKNISSVWLISNFNENRKFLFDVLKNIFDRMLGATLLLLSIIIIPFLIIAIKIDSRGPILFKQIRTGKNGKTFLAMKFRTMIDNAEKNGAQWASENDPRITKLGKFLRKTRLDEIPQCFNIIKGEMSLIGPRPERPEFITQLEKEIPFYSQRLLVKPGLSGWAQINYPYGSSIEDAMEKLEYDLYYIKNRSFALDISIILKTIHTILKGGGR